MTEYVFKKNANELPTICEYNFAKLVCRGNAASSVDVYIDNKTTDSLLSDWVSDFNLSLCTY